ncbi:hypothetical protein GGI07_005503 [Coemansia sp. Benny D115]|nr:hypothetical protein GGI07_005503 [Coemansia sp. Benny D115]
MSMNSLLANHSQSHLEKMESPIVADIVTNPTNQISVYSYTFDVPGDLPSSDHAIFAWSWVNASGNREFYMNCADVSVSGGSSTSYTGKGMTIVNYKGYETLPEFGKNYETGIELYDSKSVSQVTVTGNGGSGGGTKKGSSISSKKNDDSENNNSKVLDEEEVDSASTSSKKPTLVNFKAGVINPSSSKVQFVEDGGTSIDSLEANEKCDVDEVEEDVGKAASFVQDDEEVKCEDDEQLGSVEEDEEIKCEDDEQLGSTEQEEEVKCDEEEGVASPQEQDEQVNQGDEKCDEDEEKKPELADSQDSASTTSPSPSSRSSPSSSASPSSSQSPSSSPSSSPSPTLAMSGVAGPILNADEPMLQCTSPPGPYSFFNPMAGLLLSGVGNTPTSSAVSEIASTSILSPSATLPSSQAQTSELGILDNDESSSPDEFGAEPSITNMDLIPPYIIDNAGSSDMPSSIVDEVAGSSDSFILFEVSTSVAPTSF